MGTRPSKVLITGVAGFIGSHLAEKMRSMGCEVVGLDDFSEGYMENLSNLARDEGFKLVRGDILNVEDLRRACEEVEEIFHLAAQSSVPGSTEDPLWDFELNVRGTLNVLECARKADIETVIFASSSTVYGNAPLPTPETSPLLPISNYGASKAAGEVYCSSYSALYGLKTANLRYFNVFGPRSRKGVMFDLLRKLQRNTKKLEVLGTGEQSKDYLYIDDAVEATVLVKMRGELCGEAYNIGSGENRSVKEIVEKLLEILGLTGKTEPFYTGSSWRGDVQTTLSDISKLKALGFKPKVGFEEGLRIFVSWFKSVYGGIPEAARP